MVSIKKWVFFWALKFDFVNGLIIALGETVDLPPSDRFFNFLFPINCCFQEKVQSSLPVTSLVLSACVLENYHKQHICDIIVNYYHKDIIYLYLYIYRVFQKKHTFRIFKDIWGDQFLLVFFGYLEQASLQSSF